MSRHSSSPPVPELDAVLLETVRATVLAQTGPVTPSRVAAAVQASGRLLGTAGSLAAVDRIRAELNGLGPLQPLLDDPRVTDIYVNGPESVWVDRGDGAEQTRVEFSGEPQVRALAVRLVAAGGRRLDDSSPCVDVRLDDGCRVHAVLPPISTVGTLLSIRIRRSTVFTLDELLASGFAPAAMGQVLAAIVGRRLSFLISGATGSGKTTLLTAMLGLCGRGERLVLIEDVAELIPDHPHVLTLEARHANSEGGGTIDLAQLVRQALRMNPTRLVVGECRGAEVRELLSALNTGHRGGGCTVHANSAAAVPARLAALGALAGLSSEAVGLQAASALDVVLHLQSGPAGRRLSEVGTVALKSGTLEVIPAITLADNEAGDALGGVSVKSELRYGPGWESLQRALEGKWIG